MSMNLSSRAPNDPDDVGAAASPQPVTVRRLRLVEPPAAPIPPPPNGPPVVHGHPSRARRVLHPTPVTSLAEYRLAEYRLAGGLRGLEIAHAIAPDEIVATVLDSGLRGRGGAGFPIGRKWETVATNAEGGPPAAVVVNGAEGEPGTFKDRSIVRHNPYQVIEGAFIAARAVRADRVVIALKRSFPPRSSALATRWPRCGPRACCAPQSPARSSKGPTSTCSVRRPPCSRRSTDGDRSPVSSPRTGSGCSATIDTDASAPDRRWSTTSRPSPTSPRSSPAAPTGSGRSAPRPRRGVPSSPSPATFTGRGWARSAWAPRCDRSSRRSAAAPWRR
jgi:Respiratory-chain NADH dehydrogenase 51 Kd subunit